MVMNEMGYRSYWTREQDVAFETALADYPGVPDEQAWEKIAADVPGKTVEELKRHYEILVEDVNNIVSGHVPIPCYTSPSPDGADLGDEGGGDEMRRRAHDNSGGKGSKADRERRKGVAWTENEHKLFLLGLDKYGKGDWRSISRNYVISRTATQVASHAQKYFKRLNSKKMIKRRTSIHDITSAGTGEISASQVPNAGQGNGPIGTGEKSSQQCYQPSGGGPVIGMYGTTIRQQVGGSIITAMGTPVNGGGLPSHIAYEVRAPVSGSVIPGAPVSMPPVPYHILPNTYTI